MKYIVILLLIALCRMLKLQRAIKPYAWPQDITLTSGTFTITNNSKSIKVIRMPDYLKGQLTSVRWQNRIVLEQAYVTQVNEFLQQNYR
jgi:hypothetical protein